LFVAKVAIILKDNLAKSGYESKKTFNCPSICLATHLKPNIGTNFWQSLLFFLSSLLLMIEIFWKNHLIFENSNFNFANKKRGC